MPGKSKLNNQNSRFLHQDDSISTFEKAVGKAEERINFFNQKVPELGRQYLALMNDKTLIESKGPLAKEKETQLLTQLSSLAEQMNDDETQANSAGSMAIIMLLLIALRNQRDQLNQLEFEMKKIQTTKLIP